MISIEDKLRRANRRLQDVADKLELSRNGWKHDAGIYAQNAEKAKDTIQHVKELVKGAVVNPSPTDMGWVRADELEAVLEEEKA